MADNDTWFNEFWQCGMRKVNKKAARKAWDKLMKGKSDREQMERRIETLEGLLMP